MNWLRIFKRYRQLENQNTHLQLQLDTANLDLKAWEAYAQLYGEDYGMKPKIRDARRAAINLTKRHALLRGEKKRKLLW